MSPFIKLGDRPWHDHVGPCAAVVAPPLLVSAMSAWVGCEART